MEASLLHLALFGLKLSLLRCEDVIRSDVAVGEPEAARIPLPLGEQRQQIVPGAARHDDLEQAKSPIDQCRQPPSLPGGSHAILNRSVLPPGPAIRQEP